MTPESSVTSGFTELDRHFANFMAQLATADEAELWIAAAMVSHLTQRGHVCLDLARFAGKPLPPALVIPCGGETFPELKRWLSKLRQSVVVGQPGDYRPLVLDTAGRLYLYRYWYYENRLVDFFKEAASCLVEVRQPETLKRGLQRLFPRGDSEADWQKIAALISVLRRFAVITGGPGTGKTSTVVKILVLLLEQADGVKYDIALAAPTGKAAARLKETIKLAKETLDYNQEILSRVPVEASTLHRLMGTIPDSTKFRHHRGKPLPYDAVVVDEASMVDLPLMAKLVDALKADSRLILVGDKDQLASVEPGAVFGDVCGEHKSNSFSPACLRRVQAILKEEVPKTTQLDQAEGLRDSIVILERSYRFGDGSGIAILSRMVNEGEVEKALQILKEGQYRDLLYRTVTSHALLESDLEGRVLENYAAYLREERIDQAFQAFSRFRILCALREGVRGVETVNQLLERILARKGLIRKRGPWYRGRPILITQNDYRLMVFNGDVGILFPQGEAEDSSDQPLWFHLPAEGGSFRQVLPLRLPEHETAYAMTVHKSQGSEFDRVLLILPSHPSEVLTRELIYTGITRARKHLEIWGNDEVLKWALSRRIERNSGLRDALWPIRTNETPPAPVATPNQILE